MPLCGSLSIKEEVQSQGRRVCPGAPQPCVAGGCRWGCGGWKAHHQGKVWWIGPRVTRLERRGNRALAPGAAPLHVRGGHAVLVRRPRATGPPSLPATPHAQLSLHPSWPLSWGRAPQALSAAPCPMPWAPQMALPPTGALVVSPRGAETHVAGTERQQM